MYINQRSQLVRNVALAAANGSITLIILLIAPLGLAAVIINTILITLSTFVTATASDRIIKYLQPDRESRTASFQPLDEDPETAHLNSRENHSTLRR
ncbi:MAG: CRISPR-associated protein Csx18 [Chamaesiphon sp.]|nr:CRISPR-associated protein Csx18 [Chamaesiphon sp.]